MNHQLLKRLGDVADHLSRHETLAVLGTLDGAETDIAKIRSLMLLLRDCFASPK